jgi:hypothetical protein
MAFDFIGCTGAKPAVLKALRIKAETLRKNLDSPTARTGRKTDPATSTELEHMKDPLKFLEGFNFDDEVFEDGVPWSSWTSLLHGLQADQPLFQ